MKVWKVLTLTQPWATLVIIGAKQIETRSWPTSYKGPLLIHAAKTFGDMGKAGFYDICWSEPFKSVLEAAGYPDPAQLPLGALLGSVQLTRCSEFNTANTAQLTEMEEAFGNFALGRFGFKLERPREFVEPIPARGYQQLWSWKEDRLLEYRK